MESNHPINISNYETYMVDFWDGQLSPTQEAMLMYFLDAHPNLKNEFQDAEQYTLPAPFINFDAKDELKKQIVCADNIDIFLVGELENKLLPQELEDLNAFIERHPKYKKDRALFALTKISPKGNYVYSDKRKLKKGLLNPIWIDYARVAAVATFFLSVGLWWLNHSQTNNINLAEIAKTIQATTQTKQQEVQSKKQQIKPATSMNNRIAIVTNILRIEEPKKNSIAPIQNLETKNAVLENFESYSKNRSPDDFLGGLVNSYIPMGSGEIVYLEKPIQQVQSAEVLVGSLEKPINQFATKGLARIIKDSTLALEMKNDSYSFKTKIASAIAWATAKASGGKVKAIAITNIDGSLSALSFTNGRYNYTKRF